MATQALYRKWRSRTFEEVIGQDHVTRTLRNALATGRVAHAYLFTGPRGTGKTTTARLLAKAVNCVGEGDGRPCGECSICRAVDEGRLMDMIEIDAASNRGIDEIRDLREKVGFRPGEAHVKFYIIDEVHMLTDPAFNALLKTLEEPPSHVIFVLATTEPHKIPATIVSRCQRFDFRRIPLSEIAGWLTHIAEQEGLKVEPAALEYIARQGSGSMRDAISLLDQLTAYGSDTITLAQVQVVLGIAASQSVAELADNLIDGDLARGLELIDRVVGEGTEPRQYTREFVEYLRGV
jgi:DNA polymerase-3 subunit gamma/tau